MFLSEVAAAVGKGLFAGLAGTASITLAQAIEMKLTGRLPSDVASKVAGKILGVQPRNAEGRKRFSTVVHWGYGTAWGAARGLLGFGGVREPTARTLHFLAVWSTAAVMLPALNQAPPVTEWDLEQIATDALHHAIYAAATGAAWTYLDSQ